MLEQNLFRRAVGYSKRQLIARLPAGWVARLKSVKDRGIDLIEKPSGSATAPAAVPHNVKVLRKRVAELDKQNKVLSEFLSGVAITPWTGKGIADSLFKMHSLQPSLVMSLSSALLRDEHSFESGLLALIKIQHKRKIYDFVAELLDRYPEADIIEDCYVEAVMSYAAVGSQKCNALVRRYLEVTPQPIDRVADEERLIASFESAVLLEDADLVRLLLERTPHADAGKVEPKSYNLIRLQAEDWLSRADKQVSDICRPGTMRFGFLGYGSPLKPSTNIGDFIQTIAVMGVLARSFPDDVVIHGGGQEIFSRVAAQVNKREDRKAGSIDVVWIDRDDPSTTPRGEPIWLPVNGWFMHPKVEDKYDFPFAENVRPIFVGMHINRPQMLTPEVVAYLKKYQPIGARDYHTADLLTANGIDAFFSGCPTLSLDEIFGRPPASERSGRYRAAHRPNAKLVGNRTEMIHMDPSMPTWSKDRSLETAWKYIKAYQTASRVDTPLLHCYLPCRAMDTPVNFVNAKRDTDPRFEGLIDITEADRQALVGRLKANLDAVMDLILSGASEDDVYEQWRIRNANGVAEVKARHAARLDQFPVSESGTVKALEEFTKTSFVNGVSQGAPQHGHHGPEVVFCYDQNFDRPTFTTVRSMLANTSSPVRITLLTRGLGQDRIEALSRAFPETEFAWLDVTSVTFDNLKLLRHTTLSTMDRLFLPQLIDYADRVIYLDIDVAILGDINELYTFDLGDNALGCRQTVFPGWSKGYSLASLIEKQLTPEQITGFRQQFMYTESLGYGCFNAGVQLHDLKRLRVANFTQRLLQIVDAYGVNDQFACNLFAAGKFARLPNAWNHFATQEWLEKPKLIHYTGYIKPWDAEYCPKAEHWRSYMDTADGLELKPATTKAWFK